MQSIKDLGRMGINIPCHIKGLNIGIKERLIHIQQESLQMHTYVTALNTDKFLDTKQTCSSCKRAPYNFNRTAGGINFRLIRQICILEVFHESDFSLKALDLNISYILNSLEFNLRENRAHQSAV